MYSLTQEEVEEQELDEDIEAIKERMLMN